MSGLCDEQATVSNTALQGIELPQSPSGWPCGAAPPQPEDFGPGFTLPGHSIRLLQELHKHPLDIRISFFAEGHRYEIDGVPTLGSVTGLVHAFSHDFDPDIAIEKMINSQRWPREEYLNLDGSVMTPTEIKEKWADNGRVSANHGTWVHFLFELYLNREIVTSQCVEFQLFLKFISCLIGCKAYRTEWEIFSEEERLAGSIDFVATAPNGSLIIIDWKRTKLLRTKYENTFQCMQSPLSHLSDCKGIQYRLQLNVYKYILEKQYGFRISEMYVVCVHPDVGEAPFVDVVPDMEDEVSKMMSWQRERVVVESKRSMC